MLFASLLLIYWIKEGRKEGKNAETKGVKGAWKAHILGIMYGFGHPHPLTSRTKRDIQFSHIFFILFFYFQEGSFCHVWGLRDSRKARVYGVCVGFEVKNTKKRKNGHFGLFLRLFFEWEVLKRGVFVVLVYDFWWFFDKNWKIFRFMQLV